MADRVDRRDFVRIAAKWGSGLHGRWLVAYGDSLYRRFIAAKRRYDPAGILTPVAAIFA